MSESHFITSHLVVGGEAEKVSGDKKHVETPEQALQALQAGVTAILPDGDFDGAIQTLIQAGLTPEQAQQRVDSVMPGNSHEFSQ